jgi:hypothetical protein
MVVKLDTRLETEFTELSELARTGRQATDRSRQIAMLRAEAWGPETDGYSWRIDQCCQDPHRSLLP